MDELHSAALQFVRKISGFQKPSKANQQAFEQAVREISQSSERLLLAIGPKLRQKAQREGCAEVRKTEAGSS